MSTKLHLLAGMVSVMDPRFGAKGDDVTDDLPAFNTALGYLRSFGNPTPKLFIPVPPGGSFFLNGPLNIHQTVHIFGVGGGKGNRNPGSLLRFGKDTWGIVLHDSTTTDDGGGIAFGDAGQGGGSSGSIIEGLTLWGGTVKSLSGPYGGWGTIGASGNGTTATLTFNTLPSAPVVGETIYVGGVVPTGYNGTYTVTASTTTSVSYLNSTTGSQTVAGFIADNLNRNAHGIWVRSAYCTIRDCDVSFWPGNGIHCLSFSGSTGFTSGQANCGRIENCTAIYNSGAAIHIQGSDANAWVVDDCTASDCGSGIEELSFLGNTHIGHQTQNIGYDPLRSGAPIGASSFGGQTYIVLGNYFFTVSGLPLQDPGSGSTNCPTTAASGDGTTSTITFAGGSNNGAVPVGSVVIVAGVVPAGYNGTYIATASTATSVSYLNSTTGAQTVAGSVSAATFTNNEFAASGVRPGSIATTGASGTGTVATVTFAALSNAIPVGTTIVVSGVTPTGYNGTYTVTLSTTTSVSYANTTTGSQSAAGTVLPSIWRQWGGIPFPTAWVAGLPWRISGPYLTLTTNFTANNVFLGVYQEGSQPPNQSTSRTMFMGGSFGYTLGGLTVDAANNVLTVNNGVQVSPPGASTSVVYGTGGVIYELLYNNNTNSVSYGIDATGTLLQTIAGGPYSPSTEFGLAGDTSAYGPGHNYISALNVGPPPNYVSQFTGSISGTTLTVTAQLGGLSSGLTISDSTGNIVPGTTIIAGTGPTYTVDISQTVASETMYANNGVWIQLGAFPNYGGIQSSIPVNQSALTTKGSRYFDPNPTPGYPEGFICTQAGKISTGSGIPPFAVFQPFGCTLGPAIPFAFLPPSPLVNQRSAVSNCSTTTPGSLADGSGSFEVSVIYVRGAWRVVA